jgi:hypothetical protein
LSRDEAIIFLINFDNGFGSNLTVIVQNSLYLKNINPKLHVLGHFSDNKLNFKYHEEKYNNSFFLYFKYLKNISDNVKYYFVKLDLLHSPPFIISQRIKNKNVDDICINKVYSDFFKENFEVKIGNNIIKTITNIKYENKKPLIGVHIRSFAQILHENKDRNDTIENRILNLKNMFDNIYNNYNIFIATDVQEYIELMKDIYKNSDTTIYYNDFISRIKSHGDGQHGPLNGYNDSIINLEQYKGFKLGSDIIYDCLSLINCDYYYVSITNIAFITSFLNTTNNNSFHYN